MSGSTTEANLPEGASAEATATARPGLVAALFRSRGLWVMVDQGIVSAGNFLTANVLARFLAPAALGSYGMLTENMLLLAGLQAALIIYPYSVKSAGHPERIHGLSSAAIWFTLVIFPLLALAMVGVAAVSGVSYLAGWAIIAILFWQIQETLRRGLMADLRFRDTIWGDSIRYLGQTAVVLVLAYFGELTLGRALVGIALSAAAASIVQAVQLRPSWVGFGELRLAAREFWHLGRWALLSSLLVLPAGTAYMWVLQRRHGLAVVGAFTAIYHVFKLAHPLTSSATSLIQPAVARTYRQAGPGETKRTILRYSKIGLPLVPFYLFLFAFPGLSLKLFVGWDTPYVEYSNLLRLYVLSYTIAFFNAVGAATLGGLERPREAFNAQLVNAILSVLIGLPMTWFFGLPGLIIGGLMSIGGMLAAHVYYVRRAFHQPPPDQPEPRGFEVLMPDSSEEAQGPSNAL